MFCFFRLKLCKRRWSYIKEDITITCYDNVRLRKIVAETFINFIKIPLDKCCIVDTIQLGIQASICNGLSNYFKSVNVSDPDKVSTKADWFIFTILQAKWRERERERERERVTFWQESDQWCQSHKTGRGQFLIHPLLDQHNLLWVYTKPLPRQWNWF
jgi:hypothetical protein